MERESRGSFRRCQLMERVASFESFAKYEAAHLLKFVTFLKFLPVPEALLPTVARFYAHAGCY